MRDARVRRDRGLAAADADHGGQSHRDSRCQQQRRIIGIVRNAGQQHYAPLPAEAGARERQQAAMRWNASSRATPRSRRNAASSKGRSMKSRHSNR